MGEKFSNFHTVTVLYRFRLINVVLTNFSLHGVKTREIYSQKIFTYILWEKRCTVWKIQNSSVTQISCEIKMGEARDSKSGKSTNSEALNVEFC